MRAAMIACGSGFEDLGRFLLRFGWLLPIRRILFQNINLNESDDSESLRDLTKSEFVFVAIPEPATTNITSALGVVTFAETREKSRHVFVRDLRLKPLNIKRRVLAIDACAA